MKLTTALLIAALPTQTLAGSITSGATDAPTVVRQVHPKIEKIASCMNLILNGGDFEMKVSDTNAWCIPLTDDTIEPSASTPVTPTTPKIEEPEPPKEPESKCNLGHDCPNDLDEHHDHKDLLRYHPATLEYLHRTKQLGDYLTGKGVNWSR